MKEYERWMLWLVRSTRVGADGPLPCESDGEMQGMTQNAAGAGARLAGTIRPTGASACHAVRRAHERGHQDSILEILHPCFVRASSRGMPALPMPGGETRDASDERGEFG